MRALTGTDPVNHRSTNMIPGSPANVCEIVGLAINVARNCGWWVFPCLPNKKPACPNGFKDATNEPKAIAELWRTYPGPLIGVATGARSGFDVLDIDAGQWRSGATDEVIAKHQAARAWWHCYANRIPMTRTHYSESGGLHLYFNHAPGSGCTQSKIAPGVDTRSDGGYIIFWFATGCPCIDQSPLAPWPHWLLTTVLARPKPLTIAARTGHGNADSSRSIDAMLRRVASARPGERNAVLHWGSCRLGEHVKAMHIGAAEAERLLVTAALAVGLPEGEARATARSGLGRTL